MQRVGLAVLTLWAGVTLAYADTSLESRQAQAKQQQAGLKARISTLQKEIDQQETARVDAASQLKASESAISDINRQLASLSARQEQTQQELNRLAADTSRQQEELTLRQAELADLLRAQYASGLSPWTALLSGDDPQAIGRDLAYLSYISQAQADALRAVRQAHQRLQVLRQQTTDRQVTLNELTEAASGQKIELQKQQQERQKILAKIDAALHEQRTQAKKYAQDEQRLGQLISGLEKAIAQQEFETRQAEERRRAEQLRQQELERQAAAARQHQLEQEREAARQVREQALRQQAQAESEQKADEAREARLQIEQARARIREVRAAMEEQQTEERSASTAETISVPAASQEVAVARPSVAPSVAASGLARGLRPPVRGEVQGRFGAERPDGGIWRGVVIRASEGTAVEAIAAGKVVYADWLKGFGNILIVDHGEGYLSVYAYNQSLLRQVGDQVAPREKLATVGATGGQVEPGLYFEIRHKGAPVNPQLWLAR